MFTAARKTPFLRAAMRLHVSLRYVSGGGDYAEMALTRAKATRARRTASCEDPTPALLQEEMAALREEMALAHRLTAHFGMDDLTWNHISARTEGDDFLVTPGGVMYQELLPADLVRGAEAENETGFVIHAALYEARPDIGAVIHTHTPAITAVACLEEGLRIVTQDGAAFHGRVGYHEWEVRRFMEDDSWEYEYSRRGIWW